MVFKTARDPMLITGLTCAFGIRARYVVQDHPAYIPRVAIAPLFYLSVVARTVQGMARVRSGQAPAWPLVSDRSVRRDSRIKRDFACTFTSEFPRARCPAVTVTLEAGGADTYTQRAIPGSDLFRVSSGQLPGEKPGPRYGRQWR